VTVEVSDKDDDEPTSIGGTLDKDGDTIMELASGSDDDEDELGMSTLLLASYIADFLCRAAYQGMDSIHLCILQTYPYHQVLRRMSLPHLSVCSQSCLQKTRGVRRFLDTADAKSTAICISMWKNVGVSMLLQLLIKQTMRIRCS
jgi:hypothetical protein